MQLESRQPLFARLLGLEDQSVVVSTSGVRILVARDEIGGEERPIGPAREVLNEVPCGAEPTLGAARPASKSPACTVRKSMLNRVRPDVL
jgi:hypothetical protein